MSFKGQQKIVTFYECTQYETEMHAAAAEIKSKEVTHIWRQIQQLVVLSGVVEVRLAV